MTQLEIKHGERRKLVRLSFLMLVLMPVASVFMDIDKEALELFKISGLAFAGIISAHFATAPKD